MIPHTNKPQIIREIINTKLILIPNHKMKLKS